MQSVLTKSQSKTFGPREYIEGGRRYRITAVVRYDDSCGNGHNSFSITGQIDRFDGRRWFEDAGGCIHDKIAKHFPGLRGLLKWHLCSADGPLHYIANTTYHANDRDCWGLRKGESRQIRNGKTGKLCWKLEASATLPQYVDADERPEAEATLRYVPWCRIGEGKAPDLDAARRSAIWPDATDEELEADGLKERLAARLPDLLAEFREAVESLGFIY